MRGKEYLGVCIGGVFRGIEIFTFWLEFLVVRFWYFRVI